MASVSHELVFEDNLAASGVGTVDISVDELETLVVTWVLGGSDSTANLGSTFLYQYVSDGTLITAPFPREAEGGKELDGDKVFFTQRFDVRGLRKVQLYMVNNAGSTRDAFIYVNRYRA